MLEVRGITKTYPGADLGAVNNVSLIVEGGEIISIIGRSGSGKTTLLRMLAGLMKPDSGQILFNGQALANPDEQLIAGHEAIKMVFQDFELMPNLTVRENIEYKLLKFNAGYKSDKANELLDLCGLTEFAVKKPNELSGGQQQRLSLARALADDPEVLLMDEPFSNLDPVSKQKLLWEIQGISKELDVSLVFVTHDTRDALLISDRIAYMQGGELIQLSTPKELYEMPLNLDVMEFLGLVNKFDLDEVSELGLRDIPQGMKKGVLRAENLTLHTSGSTQVKVLDCRFLGTNYLIKTCLNDGKELVHYSEKAWSVGELAFIEIDQNRMIYFT